MGQCLAAQFLGEDNFLKIPQNLRKVIFEFHLVPYQQGCIASYPVHNVDQLVFRQNLVRAGHFFEKS
jgi:hypothetical protein